MGRLEIWIIPFVFMMGQLVQITGEENAWDVGAAAAYRRRGGHSEENPPIIEPLKYNTTVFVGQTAYLACIVKNLGDKTVSWIRKSDLTILTFSTHVFTSDPRVGILREGKSGDCWTLKISRVKISDSSFYECQVNSQPTKITMLLYLNVIDPSEALPESLAARELPLLQLDENFDPGKEELDGIIAEILGGSIQEKEELSPLNLTCIVKHSIPNHPLQISWFFNDIPLAKFGNAQLNIQTNSNLFSTTSHLLIPTLHLVNGGTYTCGGHLIYPHSVNLRVTPPKPDPHLKNDGLLLKGGASSIAHSSFFPTRILPGFSLFLLLSLQIVN